MNMYLRSIVIVALLAAVACSPEKKEKEENSNSEAFDKAQEEVKEQISDVMKEMPAPSEIPYLLMETGADFNESLLHNLKNVSNYSQNNEAAVNLGVYATDVAYLSAYEKSQKALNYITEIRPLADQLSLSGSFDPKTVERFEANLSNTDSLAMIVNEAINNADDHLRKTDRPKVAALLLAGSFIEGLYIATALVENYPNDLPDEARSLILIPLVDVIIKQEEPLIDLIELLKGVDQDDYIKTLIKDLEGLKAEYKELDVQKLMDEGRGGELLKDEALDNITNQMGKIRDDVTG